MKKIIFATNNVHKLSEVRAMLEQQFEVLSLADAGIDVQDIPETGATLEENALIKARYIHQLSGENCFADDTGLEVEALGGEPGVSSARYAGEERSDEKNIGKLLKNLEDKDNRKARFRTVIALIYQGEEFLVEGIVNGIIADECKGSQGFGYDPVFIPEDYVKTFAEMTAAEKNSMSHRGRATQELVQLMNKF
jgi:XTP/dITP diphosphohydrolase